MSTSGHALATRAAAMDLVIRDFQKASSCSREEVNRMTTAGRRAETYGVGGQIRTADQHPRAGVILSGWACEQRMLLDGRRQIFSFLIAGDPVVIWGEAGHGGRTVFALTRLEFADLTPVVRYEESHAAAGAGAAFQMAMTTQYDRLFDHIVRLGRQTACERVVHLLLELRDRLEQRGKVQGNSFRIPLTQEAMADALGLSIVHLNRTLRQLRSDGLIELKGGGITFLKPARLSMIAGGRQPLPAAAAKIAKAPAWARYG